MNKYINKPYEIKAIQWSGENIKEIFKNIPLIYKKNNVLKGLAIFSNNLIKEAKISDWIVKTATDEYFIMTNERFKEQFKQIV